MALVLIAPVAANARSERTVGWTPAQVWAGAVRFLRIDEGVAIVDKDADAGYVVFEYPDEGKTYRGALEVVAIEKDGGTVVKLILTIADRPDYVEAGMLERLERRLRDELGSPPSRPPPPKAPDKPKGDKPPPA
jgi:hypothetical protein